MGIPSCSLEMSVALVSFHLVRFVSPLGDRPDAVEAVGTGNTTAIGMPLMRLYKPQKGINTPKLSATTLDLLPCLLIANRSKSSENIVKAPKTVVFGASMLVEISGIEPLTS